MQSSRLASWVFIGSLCLAASGLIQKDDSKKRGKGEAAEIRHCKGDDCNDSIEKCKKPVKYLSEDNGCYTFVCRYGTSEAYNIQTKDEKSIKVLMELSKDSDSANRKTLPDEKKK